MTTPLKWGSEFLVNTTTTGWQEGPSIAALSNGRFVVTWTDESATGGDTSRDAVRAQVFNADGSKSGPEFLANATTTGDQYDGAVAALRNGGFAVTWNDYSESGGDASFGAVRAQVFDAKGSRSGAEFLVNTTTQQLQVDPSITVLADGRFVVAWDDFSATGEDTSSSAIRAQVFNTDGSKSGAEFLVNSTTFEGQYGPSITALAGGHFVVTWTDRSHSGGDTSLYAIRGQVFDAGGTKAGTEILVNTTTARNQDFPSTSALADGNFVVAWTDYSETGDDISETAIRGQVFNANGSKSGAEFLANSTTADAQMVSSITALADGRFVVAWDDYSASRTGTAGLDVRGQMFNADGTKAGAEFLVNSTVTEGQHSSSMSALVDGRFVVAWVDWSASGADTSGKAIRAQIFDPRKAAVSLPGTSGNDDFVGTPFADSLRGSTGEDRLAGAGGNDTLQGGEGKDTLQGDAGRDALSGSGGADALSGGTGNDVLRGGTGNDRLTGGAGFDAFVFDTPPGSGTGRDTITDFAHLVDKIRLDDDVFTTLSAGALDETHFYAAAGATSATSSGDRIIYNTSTGTLYYDADGSGGGAAIAFAVLGASTHPAITAADFLVVG